MEIGEYIKTKKEVKRCIQCDILIPSDSPRFKARKFCSRACNRRFFSLKRYHKIKNSEEYKNYRKEYYRGWVNKNRDKFNDYMREYMREAAPKYKKKKKAKKLNEKPIAPKSTIFNKGNVFKNTVEVGRGIHDTIPVRE